MIKLTITPDSVKFAIIREEHFKREAASKDHVYHVGYFGHLFIKYIFTIRQYKDKITIKYKYIIINTEDLLVKHQCDDQ